MSDEQERIKREEHWRALAELLGLSPEAAPVAEKASAPPAPEPEAPAQAEVGLIAEPGEAEPEFHPLGETTEPWVVEEARGLAALPPASAAPFEAEEEEIGAIEEEEIGEESLPVAEAPPRRQREKRRRGRRGRRPPETREATDIEEDSQAAPLAEEEQLDQPESGEKPERPRRRRRKRRRGEKAVEPQTSVVDDEQEASPAEEQEDLDDLLQEEEQPVEDNEEEEDALNVDWDVPSWNDLIASLYRPER